MIKSCIAPHIAAVTRRKRGRFTRIFSGSPQRINWFIPCRFDSIDQCISSLALHPFKVEQLGTKKRLYELEHRHQDWTNLLAMIRITKENRRWKLQSAERRRLLR
jgi:hypothetical protein